jgi:hypothetical protein
MVLSSETKGNQVNIPELVAWLSGNTIRRSGRWDMASEELSFLYNLVSGLGINLYGDKAIDREYFRISAEVFECPCHNP